MIRLFIIFPILFSSSVKSQVKNSRERQEAMKIIKQVDSLYSKRNINLNQFFTDFVLCSLCEIENKKICSK